MNFTQARAAILEWLALAGRRKLRVSDSVQMKNVD
jgi:hypothetical protein